MSRFRFLALTGLFLTLAGCGTSVDFAEHYSDDGLIPEVFLPADVGLVVSYSLRDDEQFAAIQALDEQLGESGNISKTFTDQFDVLQDLGVDYGRDLMPAFGEQFRYVYAARMKGSRTENMIPETFGVVTLSDSEKLEEVLGVLEEANAVSLKQIEDQNVYVNNQKHLYMTVYEDLLLVASTGENLEIMFTQDENDSLWDNDDYQAGLKTVGQDQMLYTMVFPENYLGQFTVSKLFTMGSISPLVARQNFVVRADDNGFRFESFVLADKAEAKEKDAAFDSVPHAAPYLFEEVPGEGLIGYYESYGLSQSLAVSEKDYLPNPNIELLREWTRSYLGKDFDDDVVSLFTRGYVLALHQNKDGTIPGFTVYVDIASQGDEVQELVDKMDEQFQGLADSFNEKTPGSLTKDTVDVQGHILSHLTMDLALFSNSASPLPAAITDSPLELFYGVWDERLLISTAPIWKDEESVRVSDSVLYEDLHGTDLGADEGLVLVDAQTTADLLEGLRALREQLKLQVSAEARSFEDFLKGFEGAIAQGHTNAYDRSFSGYLQLLP